MFLNSWFFLRYCFFVLYLMKFTHKLLFKIHQSRSSFFREKQQEMQNSSGVTGFSVSYEVIKKSKKNFDDILANSAPEYHAKIAIRAARFVEEINPSSEGYMILFTGATETGDDMSVATIVEECSEQKMKSALKRTWKPSELRHRHIQSEYLHAWCITHGFMYLFWIFHFIIIISFFSLFPFPGISLFCETKHLSRRAKSRLLNISVTSEAITKVGAKIELVHRSKIHLTISEGKFDLPAGREFSRPRNRVTATTRLLFRRRRSASTGGLL